MQKDRDLGRRLGLVLFLCECVLGHGALAPASHAQAQQETPPVAPAPQASAPAASRADVQRFRARLETILSAPGADKGYWGMLVADAETGEVLYALNAQRYFAPASNTKLFTSALALATLGPAYRFRTTMETRGALDRGRVRGDLVLVGRGDPNLSNRKFPYEKKVERDGPPEKILAELADAVAARGVRRIAGDIVADDSYFAYERFPSGWTIDDMMWSYGAAVSALAVDDNTFVLELRPGARPGAPAGFSLAPDAGFYKIGNAVVTGPPGSEQKLEVSREPGSRQFVLRGSLPLGAEAHKLTLAVEEPAEYAAQLLKRLLEARGVRIRGVARAWHEPEEKPGAPAVLAEHISLPLADDVRLLNKISQNLHAELLLRAAAREKIGATTGESALKFAQEFYQSIGIAPGDVALTDGSGLSRRDLVTPQAVVALLQYVARQSWGELFRSTLPVAGEDGTLDDRMANTAAAGRIQAKTGTLGHVNSLSGYATTARGEKLIFSMFGNNHTLKGKDASSVLDAIAVAMVEELGAAPPAPTNPPPGHPEWSAAEKRWREAKDLDRSDGNRLLQP